MLVEPEEYIFEDDEPEWGDHLGRKKREDAPERTPSANRERTTRVISSEIGL